MIVVDNINVRNRSL